MKIWTGILFASILALHIAACALADMRQTRYCRACHRGTNSWVRGKGAQLRRWLHSRSPTEAGHHWWFEDQVIARLAASRGAQWQGTGTLSSCAEGSRTQGVRNQSSHGSLGSGSFYGELERLSSLVAGEQHLPEWVALMERGAHDVPGFSVFWQHGKELVSLPAQQRNAAARRLAHALCHPYQNMYLRGGDRLTYHTEQSMHVGKILFFFGGGASRFEGRYDLLVREPVDGGYRLFATYARRDGPPQLAVSYRTSPMGQLREIEASKPEGAASLQNLARFFERGGKHGLKPFSFEKTVFLRQRSRLLRNKLAMRVTITIEGIETVDGVACLVGRYVMKKLADSIGDAMWLEGRGRFWHRPDGVVLSQENSSRFRLRLLGIPLVKGSAQGKTWLVGGVRAAGSP